MTTRTLISFFLVVGFFSHGISAQQKSRLGDNAALRYWAAFSELQDAGITNDQAKELNSILDGTAPYRDDTYKDLLQRNTLALKEMARGTTLPNCDWGLDYALADDTPVEYVRKALALGRLNVLYAFHLSLTGDKAGSAHALAAGVRFSRDVANGGSLFATVVAKDLLVNHFRAIEGLSHLQGIASSEQPILQKAVTQLGPSGLDWQGAIDRELGIFNQPEWQQPLQKIKESYAAALKSPTALPALEQALANAPLELRNVIANPERVLEQKQDFANQLQRIRATLQ